MKYYSLTLRTTCGQLHKGETLCSAVKPLTIGQWPSSSIVLPSSQDVLPQHFCVIKPASEAGGWLLIRLTDFYPIAVNDTPVAHACHLRDGDVITMEEAAFIFHTHDDDRYEEAHGIRHTKRTHPALRFALWCCSLLALLAASIGLQTWYTGRSHFSDADHKLASASVCKIEVSEYILQMHTPADAEGHYRHIDSMQLDSSYVGTCFFTTDSLLVTARHCVEPWVEFSAWGEDMRIESLPRHVQWVMRAEKSQLEQADTLLRVASRCRVMEGDSCIMEFTSDQCAFNRSRDIVTTLGPDLLPWRFLFPLYNRTDVELGDFAFLHTSRAGHLTLATSSELNEVSGELRIYGFPFKNYGNQLEHSAVNGIDMPTPDSQGQYTRCIKLRVDGTSGYSGAPVIMKRGGRMRVVGIFSKTDDHDETHSTFYAVPATEVSQYNPTKAYEDTPYRR